MKSPSDSFKQKLKLSQEEAFTLSSPLKLSFPSPTPPKTPLLKLVTSYLHLSKKQTKIQPIKQFLPIPNVFFIMLHGNAIRIFRHKKIEDEELDCKIVTTISLQFYLKCVKISHFQKYQKNKGFFLVAEDETSCYLQLLFYDPAEQQINTINCTGTAAPINCWSFIHNRQILVWCQNMKLYHYQLKDNGLRLIQSLDTNININEKIFSNQDEKSHRHSHSRSKSKPKQNQKKTTPNPTSVYKLKYSTILGQRGREQESTIVLFYVLFNEEINGLKIKCKEIVYPLDYGDCQSQIYSFLGNKNQFPKLKINPTCYEIATHNTNPQVLKSLSISQLGTNFLVRFDLQIIILQKKFEKEYFAIDNLYKKNKQCHVLMAYNSNIVASTTSNIMELNQVQVIEGKAVAVMLDFFDINHQYDSIVSTLKKQSMKKEGKEVQITLRKCQEDIRLFSMWVSTDPNEEQHRKNIFFVFQITYKANDIQKKSYILSMGKYTYRIKKLITLAQNSQTPSQILTIQKLGEGVGISQSQFYYNMWKTSKRGLEQIFSYLILSRDHRKIISELKGVLRKKTLPATKIQKILQKLQQINIQNLKTNLTEQNLIDYFHVLFIVRKLQIYEPNYEIDEKQFTQMVEISLFSLVEKIINLKIYTTVKATSVWAAELKIQPKLNLIQVFNLFRLPLIEDYHLFLAEIVKKYPISIVSVIENFPQLLPNYPMQQLIQVETSQTQDCATPPKKAPAAIKQKQLFSPIKQTYLNTQQNFLDNILSKLYGSYSTSVIKKCFALAMARVEVFNQKYKYHTVIQSSKELFKSNVANLATQNNGLYLYMIVLDFVVKCKFQKPQAQPQLLPHIQNSSSHNNTQNEDEGCSQQDCVSRSQSDNENPYQKIVKMCKNFQILLYMPKDVTYQLYTVSCVFQLMIEHHIIDIDEYNLWNIADEPIQKWLALFFLGNKQEKDLIFTEFMDIFYEKPQSFIDAMKKFINSEHCSKIQLSILIDLIANLGKQFQKQNQKIIQLIIDGFCARVQISDVLDANHFKQRLKVIILGPELLLKADKIQKLGICRKIFTIFSLEQTFLKDLLEDTSQILNRILENFFDNKLRDHKSLKLSSGNRTLLKGQIKQVRDVFKVLQYLLENVLFHFSAEELVKTYCLKLIQWQGFEEIQYLLYESGYMYEYGLDVKKIVLDIQRQILQEFHNQQDFTYAFQKNRIHVNNILEIDKQDSTNNPIVISERAKMAISDIFLQWKYIIKSKQIEEMCEVWEREQENQSFGQDSLENRKDLMNQIIQTYAQHLNVTYLENLCLYFTIATTKNTQPEPRCQKFYRYCTSLCDALLVHKKYKQACQIVCIVNEHFQMNYSLISECLLKSLVQKYMQAWMLQQLTSEVQKQQNLQKCITQKSEPKQQKQRIKCTAPVSSTKENKIFLFDNQNSVEESESQIYEEVSPLQIARSYIDLFVKSWIQEDQGAVNGMFGRYFPDDFQGLYQPSEKIQICPQLCFNSQTKNTLDPAFLWKMIQTAYNSLTPSPSSPHPKFQQTQMIYGYFFMRMGLVDPENGFQQIEYIGYNHEFLVCMLEKLMDICEKNTREYRFLNYFVFFQMYLDALTKLLVLKHHESDLAEDGKIKDQGENKGGGMFDRVNLSVVRDQLLKNADYKEDKLTLIIQKLKNITADAQRNCKKRQKQCSIKNSVRSFNLSTKLRMTTKRGQKLPQKDPQSFQPPISQYANENEQSQMMSFEQFKKIKNKIKNDKSFSEIDVSERTLIESMFRIENGKGGKGAAGKTEGKNNEMQILNQIIENSRKEVQEKERIQEEGLRIAYQAMLDIRAKEDEADQHDNNNSNENDNYNNEENEDNNDDDQ